MKKRDGDYGENAAEGYLEALGYKILKRRYRRREGEIDLICLLTGESVDTYVFAEVKYRKGLKAGSPAEAVTKAKRRRISKTALAYFSENEIEANARFDIIEVSGREVLEINHIENAFDFEGEL